MKKLVMLSVISVGFAMASPDSTRNLLLALIAVSSEAEQNSRPEVANDPIWTKAIAVYNNAKTKTSNMP